MANVAELQDFDFSDWYVGSSPAVGDLGFLDFGDPNAKDNGQLPTKRAKTNSVKHVDKKQLNKQAADRYRKKKRQQFEELQHQSGLLTGENQQLRVKCDRLESEVVYLKDLLMATVKNTSAPVNPIPESFTAQETPTAADPITQSSIPKPLVEMVSALAAERKSIMDARFAALEERMAVLAAQMRAT